MDVILKYFPALTEIQKEQFASLFGFGYSNVRFVFRM